MLVQGVYDKRRFLARFQYGCDKDLTPNKITVVTVANIPVEKESEVPVIYVIPDGDS